MRQIRKQIRYPELHIYHIHHNLLETIIKAIRNTATFSQRGLSEQKSGYDPFLCKL